jgi:hypothetical protein
MPMKKKVGQMHVVLAKNNGIVIMTVVIMLSWLKGFTIAILNPSFTIDSVIVMTKFENANKTANIVATRA